MSEPLRASPGERRSEIIVSAALLALGVAFAIGTWRLPDAPGYAQVGPKLFPCLVAAGLIVIGALLLKEALGTGFRALPEEARGGFSWSAFGWISAGLLSHLVLIAGIGFILASSLLFAAVARAFGSPRAGRDFAIGIVLNAAIYAIFTQALTLSLPWGTWLPASPLG